MISMKIVLIGECVEAKVGADIIAARTAAADEGLSSEQGNGNKATVQLTAPISSNC